MNLQIAFANGKCVVQIAPTDEWEKKLLGAVAKGGTTLDASVHYTSNGHFSYGKCDLLRIELTEPKPKSEGENNG